MLERAQHTHNQSGYDRLAGLEEGDREKGSSTFSGHARQTSGAIVTPASVDSSNANSGEPRGQANFVTAWEGLRGLAVLMTCESHNARDYKGQHDIFGRGGVTIFLVLSGYLITGILMHVQSKSARQRQQTNGGFLSQFAHVPRFLTDRMVRLYPAVIVMIAFTSSVFLYVRESWPFETSLTYQVLRVLSYTSNFETKGIVWTNCWTIALEQQFYVVWAFALPVIAARHVRVRFVIMAAAVTASYAVFCYGEAGYGVLPSWIGGFYSPYSNFYKLLFGAMLQLVPVPRFMHSGRAAWAGVTFILGLIGLAFCDDFETGPGWLFRQTLVLEPLLSFATAAIVLGTEHNGNAFLESDALRFIGRVSYAFYLYQSPIQVVAPIPQGYPGVALACMAFVCAMVSTVYIEEPLRTRYRLWRKGQR